jgi:hypothetical protein
MQEEQVIDTLRLENNPLILNELSRKVLYNVVQPNFNGPCKPVELKYMYRTTGMIKNLLIFRSKNMKVIRTLQQISEIPTNKMVLVVLNYNPLFRTRLFGAILPEYRRVTNLLATVLNTTLLFPDTKQHYIHLPLNNEFYFRAHFLRAAKVITRATAKFNTRHYVLMLHFINFVRHTAEASIFKQYPKDKWKNINLIFTYKKFGFIYNLQDLYTLNEKDILLLRIINHFNTLILSQDERVKVDLAKLEAEADLAEGIDEDTSKDDDNDVNKNVVVTNITTKASSVEPVPITSKDDDSTRKQDKKIKKIETITVEIKPEEQEEEDDLSQDAVTTDKLQSLVNTITSKPSTSVVKTAEVILQPKEKPKEVLKPILFPYNEVDSIKQHLYDDHYIYTTRVSSEKDKYNLHDKLIPSFDKHLVLEVIEKNEYKKLSEHPYLDNLTEDQKKVISRYSSYTVLKLELIEGTVRPPAIRPIHTLTTPTQPITKTVTTVKPVRVEEIKEEQEDKIVVQRVNLTKTYDQTDKASTVQRAKNLIEVIDKEAEKTIEFYPDLSPPQRQRFKKLSQAYKTIQVDDQGTTIEQLLTTPVSTEIKDDNLSEEEFQDLVPDPTILKSSVSNFDKNYLDKQFKKDVYATLISFNTSGLFVQDIKTVEKKTPLSHLVEYSVKMEDINGKGSTLHFSLPVVDSDGNCVLNGVKQRMKKQMIALPIYQISPTRVSLASNYNKTLVERNTYKANSFNFFIDKLVSALNKKNPNTVQIGYGRNSISTAVSFDYSNLAKMFNYLNFTLGTKNPKNKFGIRFYFNYNNRENDFLSQFKDEKLSEFENSYGTYCGYLTYVRGQALFIDLDNNLRIIDVPSNTIRLKTDIISLIHETYLFEDKLSHIYEYVDLKILDKKFPIIFILGFQYGLQAILEYLNLDYKLIPRRGYQKLVERLSTDPSKPVPTDKIEEDSNFHTDKVKYLNELKGLNLSPNEYVITASGALVAYDILDVNADLDIVVSEQAFKKLQNQDRIVTTQGKYKIRESHIDLGPDEDIFPFSEWYKNSVLINGYRVANLYILQKFYEELIVKSADYPVKVEKYQKRLALIDVYNKNITKYTKEAYIPPNIDISTEATTINQRITKDYQIKATDLIIHFKDYDLVFNRYPITTSLIIAGLSFFKTDTFLFEDFENKDVYYNLLISKNISMNYLKGIDSFFKFFIDPITRDILEQMNEPTNIRDLLIRATQLLSTEDYREVSSSQNHRLRSYERLPAILYNQIARQLATHVNTRSRKTGFSINPKSVYQAILEDQAFATVDELNPVKSLKEATTFTYSGMGGRTARAFVKSDRVYPVDGMGAIAETTPTNQNVAMVASTPLDPVTYNTRGFFKIPEDVSQLEPPQYLSPTNMLIPGLLQDDEQYYT